MKNGLIIERQRSNSKTHWDYKYKKAGFRDGEIHFVIYAICLFEKFLYSLCKNVNLRPKVLDMGFGSGALLEYLIKRFKFNFLGIDISSEACEKMREDFPEITFINNDVCHTGLKDEEVDAIISTQVIEHVDDRAFIKEISRI